MTEQQPAAGLEHELNRAFGDLHTALQRASDATAAISQLAPRIRAVSQVFDQIEAAVAEGRRQLAGASLALDGTQSGYAGPTLVVPPPVPTTAPTIATEPTVYATEPATHPTVYEAERPAGESLQQAIDGQGELASFRLEFESRPGPLDLRAVDEAISEHPAVRDIALLDYDGHRATLKVWVDGGASPADVQAAIRDQVTSLFSSENEVSVIALEDAA